LIRARQRAGSATGVNINGQLGIGSPVHCHFLDQPPPPPPAPPVPPLLCAVAKNLGCFNATTASQQQALLPTYVSSQHDHTTLEGCAAACSTAHDTAAAIRDGNHVSVDITIQLRFNLWTVHI
jgi:hypothetical protein